MSEQKGTLGYSVDEINNLLDKTAAFDIATWLGYKFESGKRWYASSEEVVIGQVEDHTYASVKIPVKEGMRFSVDVDSSIFGLPSWYTTDAQGVVIRVGGVIDADSATTIGIEEGAESYLYINNYRGNAYKPRVLLYYSAGEIINWLSNKVDKVEGKGLSTNDYDDTAKRLVNIVKEGRIYMGVAKYNTTPPKGYAQGGWRFYLAVGHATQPFSAFGLGMLDPHKLYAIINTGGTWHDIEIGSFATPEDIASIEERVPVEISNAISSLMPIYQVVELSDTNSSIELPEGDLEVHYESFYNGEKTGEGVLVPGTTAITHGNIHYTDTTISIDGSVNVTATITIYRKTADALQRASSMTDVLHKPFTFPHHMGYYVMNVDTRILPDITSKRSAKCTIVKMMAGVKYRAIPDFKDEESSCQAGLFDESFGYSIMYPISAEEGSRVFEWKKTGSDTYLVVNGTVVVDNMDEVIANGIFNDLAAVDAYADHQAALARYLAQQGLNEKANKTEYYPAMAVGVADNLRGRGEATEEIFSYRPSAGASNSISEEGVATMKSIKGNTVVWNQKITNGNFTDNPNSDALPNGWITGDYYITLRATISYPSEGGIKFVFNKGNATTNNLYAKLSSFSGIIAGHKYILSCDYSTNGISTTSYPDQQFALGGTAGNASRVYLKNTNGVKSRFEVIKSFSVASDTFAIQSVRGYVEGAELWIDNLMLIDLTQMFGAGNELTTVEEFYERMPMGIDPYAYNEGELLSVNVESIVTNGFNQFNGEYAEVLPNNTYYLGGEYTSIGFAEELGGTTEEIVLAEDRLYTPSTKGYIYASGTNININLSHSGVRNGEYEQYEERVHEIPEIAQYFPEGMRSAGSAGSIFDEITESEVIQRVGVRAYEEGDDDNSEVKTDGVNTVYPLPAPIVTPLPTRAINLNYPVWDWGTERAVSDVPSAPFRADIIYGFNAVDTIRTNKISIEDILRRLAEMEAKVVVEQSVEE